MYLDTYCILFQHFDQKAAEKHSIILSRLQLPSNTNPSVSMLAPAHEPPQAKAPKGIYTVAL